MLGLEIGLIVLSLALGRRGSRGHGRVWRWLQEKEVDSRGWMAPSEGIDAMSETGGGCDISGHQYTRGSW